MALLSGQIVIVTGASAGIGEATARRLAHEGATIVLFARRADRLEALKRQIESEGGKALAVAGDMNSSPDRERLVHQALDAFGRIDALVNNAGYGQRGPVELVPVDAIRENFETNLFSLIALTQLVIPVMRKQRSGRIVNLSSVAGRISRPLTSVYAATKHALEAISDGLRGELSQFGIKVVLIEPGFIKTEFSTVANEHAREINENVGPYSESFDRMGAADQRLRKMAGRPEQIAELIFKAISSSNPRARYAAPGHALVGLALKRLLPSRLFDYVLNR